MTFRRLIIGPSGGPIGTDTFAWRGTTGQSSFHTNIGPELRGMGEVPQAHRDLVAFGTAVFLADRTVKRNKGWHRSIELEIPVYDVPGWEGLADHFAETLELLSSDTWQLTFAQRATPRPSDASEHPEVDRVLLFSGGADSLCGAIRSLENGERLLLVSHWDWAGHSGVQKAVISRLGARFPKQLSWHQIHLARRRDQIGGGGKFGEEPYAPHPEPSLPQPGSGRVVCETARAAVDRRERLRRARIHRSRQNVAVRYPRARPTR